MTKEQRNAIRDTLERITQANSGRLTPEAVVQEAKSKDSPLHDCFEWDQRKAAHQYRIWQARELITSIKVEVRTDKTTLSTVAYVRDPTAGPSEQGYVRTLSLVGETEMARDVLLEEFGRARAALQRASDLASVFQLQEEIGLVSDRIEHMRVRVSQEAHA